MGQRKVRRHSLRSLVALDTPIVALTAYTAPMARLLDPHCDLLLVGDSVGMVVYGMDSTLAVTPEIMIAHAQAVMRGSQRACVVVDLPFGSYQESPQQAFRVAARIMAESGAGGVKLEGGREMAETIHFLVQRGIPVIGHVGLKPQSMHTYGGFRAVGNNFEEAEQVTNDALAVAEAGASIVLIENTYEALSRAITQKLSVPTIGIGASPMCGGQILVTEDMLGLFGSETPRFVRRFADIKHEIEHAVSTYATAVRARTFPSAAECIGMPKNETI